MLLINVFSLSWGYPTPFQMSLSSYSSVWHLGIMRLFSVCTLLTCGFLVVLVIIIQMIESLGQSHMLIKHLKPSCCVHFWVHFLEFSLSYYNWSASNIFPMSIFFISNISWLLMSILMHFKLLVVMDLLCFVFHFHQWLTDMW